MKKFKQFLSNSKSKDPYQSAFLGFFKPKKKDEYQPVLLGFFKGKKKDIKEMWEHPYSGKDYLDDNPNNHTNSSGPYIFKQNKAGEAYDKHREDLKNHYSFDKEESNHLSNYTDESQELNQYHIGRHNGEEDEDKDMEKTSSSISKVLQKHKSPKDMHVYTGTGFDPSKLGVHESGHIKVHLPAFTSTSVNPEVAQHFSHVLPKEGMGNNFGKHVETHVVKIHVPKGSHGSYIEHHSLQPEEHEFLLDKGAKLHIHPKPTEINWEKNGIKHTDKIWHAKLVHDGTNETRHMNEE